MTSVQKVLLAFLLLSPLPLLGQFSVVTCTHGETGTCRQATTCNQSDVQAAVNASSAGSFGYASPTSFGGDGVYVPAGSCTWSSPVSWSNKNINLIGANPTIQHPSSDWIDYTITNSGATAAASRISGFNLTGTMGGHWLLLTGSGQGSGSVPTTGTAWAGFFRVDHITYNYSNAANGVQIYGSVFGVFDHLNGTEFGNHFEQSNLLDAEYNDTHGASPPNTQLEGEYGGRILSAAPGSSAPGGLGSKYMDFIEDSTFSCPGNYSGALSDSESGGQRMVFRHNTLSGTCFWYAHWTRSTEWDGDLYEIYNNTNTGSIDGQNPSRFGSGTGVIFNNSFPGTWTNPHFLVDETRGVGGEQMNGPFFDCQGTRAIDGNAGDTNAPGWPCAGQIGTGFLNGSGTRGGQGSLPLLAWNNGTQTGCATGGSCTNSFTIQTDGCQGSYNSGFCTRTMANYISSTPHSVAGPLNGAVDYCQGTTTMPSTCGIYTNSYTPYTYPYPTTTGGGTTYSLTVTQPTGGTITGSNCSTNASLASATAVACSVAPTTGYASCSLSGTGSASGLSGSSGSFSIGANSTVTASCTPYAVTVATGDTRTITEPTFPTVNATIKATKFIALTTAVNVDPYNSTCGSTGGTFGTLGCTGGTSYEPSSSSSSYVAAESLDNTAVNAALASCGSGQTLEFIPGNLGELGFVLAPWSIPNGCRIILDAGIHVFASRNRTDYGGTNCGLVTTGTSGCNHWITSPSTTGSGIYGYGVLDGRGWDAYIGATTQGFYSNRIQAYCNNHGGAIDGSPACTPNASGNNSYGPNGLDLVSANNFTLYKVTVRDSGNFIVNWKGGNGFTAWGAKLIAPFEVSNTDGFDPLNSQNGTFTHGIISNGDNHVAVKSTTSHTHNITFSQNQTGAGIAIAVGTDINASGIANLLVTDNVQRGNLFNSQSAGLQIGSSTKNGGLVDTVTFQNDCMVNEQNSVRLYTNYGGQTGTSTPNYTNILFRNIHVLPSTAPYTTGNSGTYTFQGLASTPIVAQLDNFVIDGVNQGVASQSGVTHDQYATLYLGPGTVDSSLPPQFSAGTGVTTIGSGGSSTPYACSTSSWKPLVGDLNLKTAASNNNQSYSGASASYTLQVVLQPATEISSKESPALTQPVTFLDNGSSIGTAALSGDGTFASLTVASPAAGSHLYTARYPGDSNYSSFTFGSVVTTIVGPTSTPPPPTRLTSAVF